jgi:L-threonylcarbamoyladenylate synthase
MPAMKDDIKAALQVLRNGGTIIYPTDTIWGIGCDATNKRAVSKIYEIKERRDEKSMLVLLHSENLLPSFIREVPDIAWQLIDAAVDPITIIYPEARNLAENLIGPDRTIGIRVTADPFCSQLIAQFKRPIVSTSANISGMPSPSSFREIDAVLLDKVDYVVQWRQDDTTPSKPSSIIKLGTGGEIEIIRK